MMAASELLPILLVSPNGHAGRFSDRSALTSRNPTRILDVFLLSLYSGAVSGERVHSSDVSLAPQGPTI